MKGTSLASHEYGPFGEVIRATGPMAKANPIRFSTKYQDDESDLLYYGYRYYKASTGTWLSRDPLTDYSFFKNTTRGLDKRLVKQFKAESLMPPYEFVRNDPIDSVDKDGRQEVFPIPLPPQSPCEKAITDTLHDIGNIRNDKRAHCIHSCQIGKACGKWVCNCLGTLKESRDLTMGGVEWTCSWVLTKSAQDWLHDNIQGGNVDDSAGDFAANDWGMSIAKTGGDCVKECEARYGPEPGE